MKATIKTLTANPTYATAKTAGYAYLGFALYQSFSHIVELSVRYGCSSPWVSPLLVDSLMLLGKLIRSPKMAKSTQRVGLALQIFGAIVSLTANILAGQTVGDRVQGAAVIIGFLIVEWVIERSKPVQVDDSAAKAAAKATSVAKAKATRAANKAAAAAEQARKDEQAALRRERARMDRQIKKVEQTGTMPGDLPAAPVSPAPAGAARIEGGYL
jgi:hypothetical protein